MITIKFLDRDSEKRALAFLLGRSSGRVLRSGEHLIPETALEALAEQNIPFTVLDKVNGASRSNFISGGIKGSLDQEEVREEWIQAVHELIEQIREWTREKNWTVRESPREIFEEEWGAYIVPDVTIDTPRGSLILEVKARGVPEAAGRVELAAWPTLYRVMLLHRMGQTGWTIRTDSGIALRQPWTKETFLTLAEDLLAAI